MRFIVFVLSTFIIRIISDEFGRTCSLNWKTRTFELIQLCLVTMKKMYYEIVLSVIENGLY